MSSHNTGFFASPSVENSYWAGLLAADGCIWKRGDAFELALKDRDHVEAFAKAIGHTLPISSRADGTHRVICYGAQSTCADLLSNYSLTPRKSLTLQPPSILDDSLIAAFIIGLIDGDGNIDSVNGRLRMSITGAEPILNWVKRWFDVRFPSKRKSSMVRKRSHSMAYYYQITSGRARRALEFLAQVEVPKMARKWDKVEITT